ncbi:MAG: helix-turn-helix transcriptional regulator [Gordonia sp. (in: high G+C Gram-positive bacteria)]
MRKSLRTSGVGVQEMADYLDVSRNAVGTWINGRVNPSVQTIRLWALRTGVPFVWLQTGETPAGPDDGPGGGSECAIRDSNPEPAD